MFRIGRMVAVGVQKFRAHLRHAGFRRTLAAAVSTAAAPVVRRRERLIREVKLGHREPSIWERGEKLMILGPENMDRELNGRLRSFLGGPEAAAEIEGVRGRYRLFVVGTETDFLVCSYFFFDTTNETRRQARIYERRNTPIIGMSFTSPAARGKGLYRRILNEIFRYLAYMNCDRAVCEAHPGKTSNKASQAAGVRACSTTGMRIIFSSRIQCSPDIGLRSLNHFGFLVRRKRTLLSDWMGFRLPGGAYSPDMVLVAQSIRNAIEGGLRYVDFLRCDEPYKWRLTKSSRKIVTLLMMQSFLVRSTFGLPARRTP